MDRAFDPRSLPMPTDEQFAAFAEHVGEAHSWYKHLPLLTGREFVVFLAPDSGVGCLVARMTETGYELVTPPEGPVFTEANPRLHYSWKTSEEYRRRFGYLDYASRGYDGTLGRDVGGPMHLRQEILDRCSFTLFPYVAGGDSGRDSIGWAHEEAVAELRAGAPHPLRETLLEWARLAQEHDASWQSMTDAERDAVTARWREEVERPRPHLRSTATTGSRPNLKRSTTSGCGRASWRRSGMRWTSFARGWRGGEASFWPAPVNEKAPHLRAAGPGSG